MKHILSLLLGLASNQDSIIDVAVSNGSFTTLVAAVGAAGLVDTLKSAGPFTVFAPTDDAFAALPVGLIEYLLEPDSKDELTAVLLYHVLAGEVNSAAAIELDGDSVETVGTEEIEISLMGDSLMINDATVSLLNVFYEISSTNMDKMSFCARYLIYKCVFCSFDHFNY
jgi:uncharacterized surface protein with fasciclin (FAS1) repeats